MSSKLLLQKVKGRSVSQKETDKSALFAIAQAALNVELFTIPLYMTSLYSLEGTHQITGSNDFYLGRLWPGMSTTARPVTANHKAFNAVFSVFIAEMLHLQLAGNINNAIGQVPDFTSKSLQTENYGWKCYGPKETVIPHIIDFKDTIAPYNAIKVKLDALNLSQIELFLAIEETEEDAHKIIKPGAEKKYFPSVPFADWQPTYDENNLPMFGSIGHMYLCLYEYLSLEYEDGTTLWDYVYAQKSIQRDIFNGTDNGHKPEYPRMSTVVETTLDSADAKTAALHQIIDMIQGITDQGEGKGVIGGLMKMLNLAPNKVKNKFQPDHEALEADYPTYNDKGEQMPRSADAAARTKYGKVDHYETFAEVKGLLETGEIVTWDMWHKKGNTWKPEMLLTTGHEQNKYPLPSANDIAGALNRLKENDGEANYKMFSQVVAGAIKGVTAVLNDYWSGKTSTFPFPSMSGSGDRMSICWAIFGKAPDLTLGVEARTQGILYHACQGMNLDPNNPSNPNNCAAVEVFHTCKGSNSCKAEGGCGFVQSVQGGGSCSSGGSGCGTPSPKPSGGGGSGCGTKLGMMQARSAGGCGHKMTDNGCGSKPNKKEKNLCGGPTPTPSPSPTVPTYYSAPSDNKCASFGGCAVPISASQIYPSPDNNSQEGQMELFNFIGTQFQSTPINTMGYKVGDLVYDVAWNAYIAVLQERNRPIPAKPKPSDLRLAFPPST